MKMFWTKPYVKPQFDFYVVSAFFEVLCRTNKNLYRNLFYYHDDLVWTKIILLWEGTNDNDENKYREFVRYKILWHHFINLNYINPTIYIRDFNVATETAKAIRHEIRGVIAGKVEVVNSILADNLANPCRGRCPKTILGTDRGM